MRIVDIIQEFIPCEVCGNRDVKNFYFHVVESEPYVRCNECEEEYLSSKAKEVLVKIEEERKKKARDD